MKIKILLIVFVCVLQLTQKKLYQGFFNIMTNDGLSFSQAQGYLPIPDSLKLEELPIPVRQEFELCIIKAFDLYNSCSRNKKVANWREILRDLWVEFLGKNALSYHYMDQNYLRIWILQEDFNRVFDLLLELVKRTANTQPSFYADIKAVFERRKLAYRLIGSVSTGFSIIPTTNELEVLEVNNTFQLLSLKSLQFDFVIKHFMCAGKLLTEGEYGKSVHESASAVEALLRILKNSNKAHPEVLQNYWKSIKLHGVYEKLIKQIINTPYQFASDISGGRH